MRKSTLQSVVIGSFVILLIIAGTSTVLTRLTTVTSNFLLEAKDIELDRQNRQLAKVKTELSSAQNEIETKKAELAKATESLNAKLKELDTAQKKIKSQESQIAANSTELSKLRNRPPLFSFKVDATKLVNSETKKEEIKQVVTDAYDVIADVYGVPYLLHSVTINLVDSLSNPNAGAETEISNGPNGLSLTIRLTDFDRNSFNDVNGVIHELIHTFHGLAILNPIAYEEGITVAAADAVMEKLIASGKTPSFKPLYVRMSKEEYASTSLFLPQNDAQFYASADVGQYYQIAGYGWLQLYRSDTAFFRRFNEKIYNHKKNGTEITQQLVLDTVRQVISSAGGMSISDWLATRAFVLK